MGQTVLTGGIGIKQQQISRSQSTRTTPKRDQMRDLTGAGSGTGQTVYWGNRNQKTANVTIPVNSHSTTPKRDQMRDLYHTKAGGIGMRVLTGAGSGTHKQFTVGRIIKNTEQIPRSQSIRTTKIKGDRDEGSDWSL